MFSTRFLLQSSAFSSDTARAGRSSDELAERLAAVEGVSDVWHFGAPVGHRSGSGLAKLLSAPLLREQVAVYYFDKKSNVLQLEVMQEHPPMSLEAVAAYNAMKETIHEFRQRIVTNSGIAVIHRIDDSSQRIRSEHEVRL